MSVHLTTRSCGLFGGGASSNQSVLLEYRWETALEPQHLQQNFTTEHEQEWAQLNHICSAKQTALISRVRLVVDAAHARSCHPNSNNTTDNLLATTWDDTTWNGVTTRRVYLLVTVACLARREYTRTNCSGAALPITAHFTGQRIITWVLGLATLLFGASQSTRGPFMCVLLA